MTTSGDKPQFNLNEASFSDCNIFSSGLHATIGYATYVHVAGNKEVYTNKHPGPGWRLKKEK